MEGVGLDAPGEQARADFGAFFSGRYAELGAAAYRLCGDRAVAEEITADAFAEAWRRWDKISRSDSASALMQEILARHAESRLLGNVPEQPDQPQEPYQPDAERIQALLYERIALIPQQRTMTVTLGGGAGGGAGRRTTGGSGRFRRPGPIGIVIAVNAVAALVAIVVTMYSGGSSSSSGHTNVSIADTATADSTATGSRSQAATESPTHSASASASPSPTPDQSTNSAPASTSAATTVAAAFGSPSTAVTTSTASSATTASSVKLLTATGTVNASSNSAWTELDVATDIKQTLSAMTVTVKVAHCAGLSTPDSWNNGAGGQFTETTTTNSNGSLTYVFALTSGDEVGPGDVTFAAQFSHSTSGWYAAADTYTVTAQSASSGATEELGGSF